MAQVIGIGKSLMKLTWRSTGHPLIDDNTESPVTVLAVTHALDFMSTWDMVMVVGAGGKIAEFGYREELLKRRGKYWYMVNQADGINVGLKGHATIKPGRLLQMWPFCSAPSITHLTVGRDLHATTLYICLG
jgi:hypothetical protein